MSVDTERQLTLYIPAFNGLSLIRIVWSLTCGLPWLTSMPFVSVTIRLEKVASSLSVNVSIASSGATLMVEPTGGLACARDACACAAAALTGKKSNDVVLIATWLPERRNIL